MKDIPQQLAVLLQQGFTASGQRDVVRIDENDNFSSKDKVFIVIDRIIKEMMKIFYNRLAGAIDTAFFEGKGGLCRVFDDRPGGIY
jgi:excinuclease ABC subunit A